ncbi:uncharacterized protein TRAVEDRAFT_53821 [Trametes versicolor FP-101664 SS1]|uniref:uncharacterized protein n=1 Tax=Trametes versicolor (strain FP-101664) TaxID=717944 RepID=UPI0004623AB8|nr:uncharacterized protein TRAVEDRAFT_53821 [Trametes versicolor FP-101664 SS1]EIW52399.1 hypothetical protein TRAVEDRAFT_53821 [Trametes versicolor FP-101664 SS1]
MFPSATSNVWNAGVEVPGQMRMNTIAPVNRLPPEILSVIFDISSIQPLVHELPRKEEWATAYHSARVLQTQIMAVCRLWRDTALSTSSLWSDIASLTTEGCPTSIQLSRAQGTTLCLYSGAGHRAKEILPVLASHTHRIRVLWICDACGSWIPTEDIRDVFLSFPELAHCIEEITVHANSPPTWPLAKTPSPPPRTLFSGFAPQLRVLRLTLSCLPFIPEDTLPNLTELYLDNDCYVTHSSLLLILERAPMLEQVYLATPIPWSSTSPPLTGRIVPMPKLRRITLDVQADPSPLLRALALPPSCLVKLTLSGASDVPGCLAALEGQLDCSQLTRLSLNVDWHPERESGDVVLITTVCNASATQGLALSVQCDGRGGSSSIPVLRETLTTAFRTSPIYADVRELTVFVNQRIVDAAFLDSLPRLTTLNHIFCRPPPTYYEMLEGNYISRLMQVSPDGRVTCPSLTTLYFIDCPFDALADARAILEFRKQHGRPLTRLGIDCSVALKHDVRALGKRVKELDVNFCDVPGYEGGLDVAPEGGWRGHSARARRHWPP